jgi:cytochrome c553
MIGRALRMLATIALIAAAAVFGRKPAAARAAASRDFMKPKIGWKGWALRGAALAAVLGAGGFLVSASGIIPIKASSRHWAVTRWFLNFSKERSVATHSLGIKVPDLDVEWRILKGAGHFETGCRPCHGGPDAPQPRIPHAMTPNPPPLGPEVSQWKPSELFYIVKHGIKFTGMPGWPAENRDDEIWAVVAFLRKLPALEAAQYRDLVHGGQNSAKRAPIQDLLPPESIRPIIAQNCARCHGHDGNGRRTGAFPKLAGQKAEYLRASLAAYASGTRHSGIMEPIAAAIDSETLTEIANYYSGLRLAGTTNTADAAALEAGRRIAAEGIPSRSVAACNECHEHRSANRNPAYPRLAGQYAEYLQLQLELFQKRSRGGTEYAHIMHHTADGLTARERHEIAMYFASLRHRAGQEEEER